jgi:DNA-directed RNA polymerase subunit M/transcription elongation factor TFIIS
MTINFNCPECGTMLGARDGAEGRKGTCPRCKKSVTIPGADDNKQTDAKNNKKTKKK